MPRDRRIIITVNLYIFLSHSSGSLAEVETQLHIAEKLGYADATAIERILQRVNEVGRILNGLISSIREQIDPRT